MKSEITALKKENLQGIVVGVLEPGRGVDLARTRELVDLARPLPVTFHRAFDETPDPAESLESVIQTGARRILTSGGALDANQGARLIRKLIEQATGRIGILPGGGLHAANIAEVAWVTGAAELHTGLGSILPYNDPDSAKCESAIRACVAALVIRRNDNSHNTGFPPPP
jgi:copper homeostasis protein